MRYTKFALSVELLLSEEESATEELSIELLLSEEDITVEELSLSIEEEASLLEEVSEVRLSEACDTLDSAEELEPRPQEAAVMPKPRQRRSAVVYTASFLKIFIWGMSSN
jgi:hypothetical protein